MPGAMVALRFKHPWNGCKSNTRSFIANYGGNGTKPKGQLEDNNGHCRIHKDIWLWNSMITRNARSERIEDAVEVFEKMSVRDVTSWNSMIAAYVQNGRMEEAHKLFEKIPDRDVVSWTIMVAGYVQNRRIEDAHCMFDKMPERNVVSWNSMMTGYVRCGRLDDACDLFNRMPERNVISWTAIVAGHVRNGRIADARLMFDKMPVRDVVSWTEMITGYSQCGRIDDACRLFEIMPERNLIAWTAMIEGYIRNGKLDDASRLFERMPKRNLFSWNSMIAGYAQNHRLEHASQLFDRMPEKNVISWNTMIAGCVQSGKIDDAQRFFNEMPNRNVVSWTTIIGGCAQNGQMDYARYLFDKMPERDVVSWNAVIAGYVQNRQYEESLKWFFKMLQTGMRPNESSFLNVLSACTSLACLELGKQIHDHITKTEFELGILLRNALITMYASCGSIDDAKYVFDQMPERDVVSWTAMIIGHAQHGYGKEGIQLFKQMQLAGINPDHVTFIGVLFACSHEGLVDEGRKFFESITKDHHITVRVEHSACMVDLLARNGLFKEAQDFINRMPFDSKVAVWRALLGACRLHMNLELGEHAAKCLLELEPRNSGAYVLLSNIYAAARRWDDVLRVRMVMKTRGFKKQPGCSWIEVKNKVHAFIAGDRSHPETEKIYSLLEILTGKMKDAEYMPDTNFVLHDMDKQQNAFSFTTARS